MTDCAGRSLQHRYGCHSDPYRNGKIARAFFKATALGDKNGGEEWGNPTFRFACLLTLSGNARFGAATIPRDTNHREIDSVTWYCRK